MVIKAEYDDEPPVAVVGVPGQTDILTHAISRDLKGSPMTLRSKGNLWVPETVGLSDGGKSIMTRLPERVVVIGPDFESGQAATEALVEDVIHAWHNGLEARRQLMALHGAELSEKGLRIGRVATGVSSVGGSDKWHLPHATAWPYERVA